MSFEFNEKNHSYKLDGKRLTGVTTILNVIAKPALIGWAAKMASGYIESEGLLSFGDGQDFNPEKFKQICDDGKKAHLVKRDKAGDIGTIAHKMVENYIKEVSDPVEGYSELSEVDKKKVRVMVKNFTGWATDNNVKFLASEQRVYSRKYWYAGTFDFLCEINGKKFIGDLKTSSGIFGRSFFFQMAGYKIALEEMKKELKRITEKDDEIVGSVVVRCGKKGDFEEKYSYDIETDKKGFLACLDLYRSLGTF